MAATPSNHIDHIGYGWKYKVSFQHHVYCAPVWRFETSDAELTETNGYQECFDMFNV